MFRSLEEGGYNPSGWHKPIVMIKKVVCCVLVMRNTQIVIIVAWSRL